MAAHRLRRLILGMSGRGAKLLPGAVLTQGGRQRLEISAVQLILKSIPQVADPCCNLIIAKRNLWDLGGNDAATRFHRRAKVAVRHWGRSRTFARLASQRRILLRTATNIAQPRANHGNVSNFGLTITKSQCVTNKLTAYAKSITRPPVIQ